MLAPRRAALRALLALLAATVAAAAAAPAAAAARCFAANATAGASACAPLPPPRAGLAAAALRPGSTCGRSTAIPAARLGSCAAGAQAALNTHNAARARYGAPPLLWSPTLAAYAQTVSDTCVFRHSNGPYGENLAIGRPALSCAAAVGLWVAEESSWSPGGDFSVATGHFTQVVWKGTERVGCAVARCGGEIGDFITCSYHKAGNVLGRFGANVGARGARPRCVAPI